MNNVVYGVYGASGFGREVMPILKRQADMCSGEGEFVFIDDALASKVANGYSVVSFEDFVNKTHTIKKVAIAIANSKIREALSLKLVLANIQVANVKATTVDILDEVEIEDGYILCPHVTLTSNIKIGKSFHANLYSYVAHDCIIGDYVTFAPSVKCNGNVIIENHAYLGTGAIIKQGRPNKPIVIGEGAIIGAGAFVTKSVAPYTTVIGNPARLLSKENLR